jgi:hypothetical protein
MAGPLKPLRLGRGDRAKHAAMRAFLGCHPDYARFGLILVHVTVAGLGGQNEWQRGFGSETARQPAENPHA